MCKVRREGVARGFPKGDLCTYLFRNSSRGIRVRLRGLQIGASFCMRISFRSSFFRRAIMQGYDLGLRVLSWCVRDDCHDGRFFGEDQPMRLIYLVTVGLLTYDRVVGRGACFQNFRRKIKECWLIWLIYWWHLNVGGANPGGWGGWCSTCSFRSALRFVAHREFHLP